MDTRKLFWIISGILIIYASTSLIPSNGSAQKTIPRHTTVQAILSEPDLFDGATVHITGQIMAMEQRSSRRGHIYRAFTISALHGEQNLTLDVFAYIWPSVRRGDTVTIEGTYHVNYWFGGWPFENFIDADLIKKESVL